MNRAAIMKLFYCIISVVAGIAFGRLANGHGIPISVTSAGSALVVSGEVSGDGGFAPVVFVQADSDGDPSPPLSINPVGNVVVWQVPAFDISGMNAASSLSLDVMSRPLKTSNPVHSQVLWFWDLATQTVKASSAPLYLLGTGHRFETLAPADSVSPTSFLLADPIGGDQSQGGQQFPDNHGLLAYALDNDNVPAAAPGAYGFFARLTSDQYGTSNPFLVVFNYGVDYSQITAAALAINAAAFLPGDYNHNDHVDATDYVIWRKTLGSTTALAADGSGNQFVDGADYALWRNNMGHAVSASGQLTSFAIPEPTTLMLFCCSVVLVSVASRRSIARASAVPSH
jgi:hypothetical protein